MQGRHTLHPAPDCCELQIEGMVTMPELRALLAAMMADPAWNPECNGIADFTKAQVDLRFGEVLDISESLRNDPRMPKGCWAGVVGSTADYGVARMFQTLSGEFLKVEMFRSRREAEEWFRSKTKPVCGTEI